PAASNPEQSSQQWTYFDCRCFPSMKASKFLEARLCKCGKRVPVEILRSASKKQDPRSFEGGTREAPQLLFLRGWREGRGSVSRSTRPRLSHSEVHHPIVRHRLQLFPLVGREHVAKSKSHNRKFFFQSVAGRLQLTHFGQHLILLRLIFVEQVAQLAFFNLDAAAHLNQIRAMFG